jgi:hypothetical protein
MRKTAVMPLLVILVLLLSLQQSKALSGQCCEYAMLSSDTQPKPGELVNFEGVVTDQFGGGDQGVQIQYHDSTQQQGFLLNATTDVNGAFNIVASIPQSNYPDPIQIIIKFVDTRYSWQSIVTDTFPAPSSAPPGLYPGLYSSSLGNSRGNAYLNVQAENLPTVLYIGGGYEQPVLHGDPSFDQSTTNFLSNLAGEGLNIIAPIGWNVINTPTFPYVLGAMLKYALHIGQVYLIGWSAGGIVAAWTLTHDLNGIFDLGVIMDAELNGPQNQTQTDPSVFTTLQSAGSVRVPHLLIWGQTEGGSTSVQNAIAWTMKAQPGLARLDTFAYIHQWIGTDVEAQISADITGFFNAKGVGTLNHLQSGNVAFQVLTNSQFSPTNATYDPVRKSYAFETTGPEGTTGSLNIVIPISSIDGPPVALIDNSLTNALYSSDTNNYYVYLTYPQSSHTLVVAGQNAVPEFGSDPRNLQIILTFCMLVLFTLVKKRNTR